MPGSRPSSSIRSWTMPSYNARLPSEAGDVATTEGAEGVGSERVGLALGVAVGGDDHVAEVAQVVGVGGVEAAGGDLDLDQLTDTVDGHADGAAGHGALDLGVGQAGLRRGDLLLHLLGLLHEGVHVEAAGTECVEGVLRHGRLQFAQVWRIS